MTRELTKQPDDYQLYRYIKQLVAEISPKPDDAASVRKLAGPRGRTQPSRALELRPDEVASRPGPAPAQPVQPAVLEPLSPAQILAVIQRGCQPELRQTAVQFTASAELHKQAGATPRGTGAQAAVHASPSLSTPLAIVDPSSTLTGD